jgi:hypothetical protein
MEAKQMDRQIIIILRLRICDDVDRLHVEIDNINDLLVGFCFIRSIDINGNQNVSKPLRLH